MSDRSSWCARLPLILAAAAMLLTVPALIAPARGQCELRWRKIADGALPSRGGWVFATDPADGEVYAAEPDISGIALNGRLWRSTPSGWRNIGQGNTWSWPNRTIAFDAARRRLVTVQPQQGGGQMMDVWEWGGSTWNFVPNAPGAPTPQRRSGGAIIYDAARGVTLLFGGYGGGGLPLNDLWAWDGERWTVLDPGGAGPDRPVPLSTTQLVFDPVRGVAVLLVAVAEVFGTETWEWNGESWRLAATADASPLPGGQIIFDTSRGKVVRYGPNGHVLSPWVLHEWDGSGWTQVAAVEDVAGFDSTLLVSPHDGRLTLIGESHETAFAFDGAAWVESTHGGPPPRRARAVFDGGRGVMVMPGGAIMDTYREFEDVWEFDGSAWMHRPGSALNEQLSVLPVYHALRGAVYALRGGGSGGLMLANIWNGAWWEYVPPTPGSPIPEGRSSSGAAYDSERGVAVMFGGFSSDSISILLGDTWEYDGEGWARITPPVSPSPRGGHAMTYDPIRRRTLLYGGGPVRGPYSDELWAYDGGTGAWTLASAEPGPLRLYLARMTFDTHRGVALLFGGLAQPDFPTGGLWEWDGTAWTFLNVPGPRPSPRAAAAFVYDPHRRASILYGGSTFRSFGGLHPDLGDTWLLHRAADHDIDGAIDSRDIAAFLEGWARAVAEGATDADFDLDGATTAADISAFLEAWLHAVQNGC